MAPRPLIVLLGLLSTLHGCDLAPDDPPTSAADASVTDGGSEAGQSPPGPRGLAGVEIVIDRHGISHVYAPSDAEAFRGAGYAMARDRLFQMELQRRRALGTRAALLGEDFLDADIAARTLGFGRLGVLEAELLEAQQPADLALVAAWAAGVNQYIAEIRDGSRPRPYGFATEPLDLLPEDWSPAHSLAVGKMLTFGLSSTLEQDLLATVAARLAPTFTDNLSLVRPAFDSFITDPPPAAPAPPGAMTGASDGEARSRPGSWALPPGLRWRSTRRLFPAAHSNNWAVAGAHSDNGRPLLAGDPHQPTQSPGVLWPVHIHSRVGGGSLDVIGFAFPGTPGVQLGHNARLAWTATTSFADVTDIFSVKVRAGLVPLGGRTRSVLSRMETVTVKDLETGERSEQPLEVRWLDGVGVLLPEAMLPVPVSLIVDEGDTDLLLAWTGLEPSLGLGTFLALDRAQDLDAFEAAVELQTVGAQNFVAATAEGIAHRVHAHVPDRGEPASRPMPGRVLSGADPAHLWTGALLSGAQLPAQRDPARGYIVTANNDPFGFTADGDVQNDPFYYGSYFARGFRAHRIDQRLGAWLDAGRKLGLEDMQSLQADSHSPVADVLLPLLQAELDAVGADGVDEPLRTLAAGLMAWDRSFRRDSGAALAFLGLEWFATRRAFGEALGPLLFDAISDANPAYLLGQLTNLLQQRVIDPAPFFPDGEAGFLLAALEQSRQWLIGEFGSADLASLRLDQAHAARFGNDHGGALDRGRIAVDGSADTVNVSPASFFLGATARNSFNAEEQSAFRMVVAFDADGTPRARLNFALGASGEPGDPHFDDQREAWVQLDYFELPFRPEDVEAQLERVIEVPPLETD